MLFLGCNIPAKWVLTLGHKKLFWDCKKTFFGIAKKTFFGIQKFVVNQNPKRPHKLQENKNNSGFKKKKKNRKRKNVSKLIFFRSAFFSIV